MSMVVVVVIGLWGRGGGGSAGKRDRGGFAVGCAAPMGVGRLSGRLADCGLFLGHY